MTMKVLVVEDDPANRETLRKLLEAENYAVCLAWTCSGALRQLTLENPDLVLLDIDLGEEVLSGIDVARVMGGDASWRRIPIIVTSGIPTDEIRERARGADAFSGLRAMVVQKPIDTEVLLREMRKMLGVL